MSGNDDPLEQRAMAIARSDVIQHRQCRAVLAEGLLVWCIGIEAALRVPALLVETLSHLDGRRAIALGARLVSQRSLQIRGFTERAEVLHRDDAAQETLVAKRPAIETRLPVHEGPRVRHGPNEAGRLYVTSKLIEHRA